MAELTDKRKDEIQTYVLSVLWPLNATGSSERAVDMIISAEENYYPNYPAELIGKRYQDYFNKWQSEHDSVEERYIRNDDKLKDIYQFMVTRGYQEEYAVARKGRDFYMFGDKTKEELRASLAVFMERIKNGRK